MPHSKPFEEYDSHSINSESQLPDMESANQRVLRHLDEMHQFQNPIVNLKQMRDQASRQRVTSGGYEPKQSINKGAFTTNAVLNGDMRVEEFDICK